MERTQTGKTYTSNGRQKKSRELQVQMKKQPIFSVRTGSADRTEKKSSLNQTFEPAAFNSRYMWLFTYTTST
ncbi:hypothetical protein A4R26_19105 [Niastella populi]|uniref:Uncharacterized protein n=1 Tax=Niastella populi TaxID=550983 RepID=A0A1V9FTG5_9BACT|nr:hypothetical protein A4R26_19105 [Niastella populi]